MSKISFLLSYLHYYATAQTRHDIHSPFFFNLIEEVINKKNEIPVFHEIKKLHRQLKNNPTAINFIDLGAGSAISPNKTLLISDIAKNSAKPTRYAQLMYRLVTYFNPTNILELGTSLGLTTIYMAKAAPNAKVLTLEGCDDVAKAAATNFSQLGIKNIELVIGAFEKTLQPAVEKCNGLDFVFFDGNHQKLPTLHYFEMCLTKKNTNTIFIFDDINWSHEMQSAWETIKQHPDVTATIDLFMMGMVFFNPDFSKQHFKIRF
jgi:predicted O-methyltransferase YrrM